MLTDLELGWIVGLLEGEGCFECHLRHGTHISRAVRICMTDEDVILRFVALIYKLTGRRYNYVTKKPMNKKWSDSYMVQIYGKQAILVMKLIVSHMGFRRRQKIWQVLNGFVAEGKLDNSSIIQIVGKGLKDV